MKLLERRRDELAAAPLDEFLRAQSDPARALPAMVDAWFAHVEEHPHASRMLFQDAIGDTEVEELQRELRRRQRAADVALLREFAPGLPESELEPLGEIIRSSLAGLALSTKYPGLTLLVPLVLAHADSPAGERRPVQRAAETARPAHRPDLTRTGAHRVLACHLHPPERSYPRTRWLFVSTT